MEHRDFDSLQNALAGRYVLRKELGRGGTAIVFLADDVKRSRLVALKVLRPELAAALGVKRFLREIQVASALEHPNILPLLESGEANGLPFFVMPSVDGGSLYDLMSSEGALPFDRVLEIGRGIANALDHAHAKGIVHRDIKPENILFQNGQPVVTDFGIAKGFAEAGGERLTESGVAIGTPRYMSPEQAGNERLIDGRSDVYSLGCLVFEMIGGEPPFTGYTAKVVLAKQMTEPPPKLAVLRPTVTLETQEAVERALAKQRADRFSTAGEFIDALERSYSGITARRRRALRYAATAAALALVVVASGWVVRRIAMPPKLDDSAEAARHVAVLYFEDLTPEKRLSHIAAGLTEDLIDRLSQVQALHVISPNGVRPFRDTAVPMDTLAKRLNVGTVIGGSVAGSGPLLRLTVRLIDARSGKQLHSRTIEKPSWDLFKLQDSVNSGVELWLREHLGGQVRLRERQRSTKSVEAWETVQRAEELTKRGQTFFLAGDFRTAAPLLAQSDSGLLTAQRMDPRWLEPAVHRARNANIRAYMDPRGFAVGLSRVIELADSALSRQPNLIEALAIRGAARLRTAILGPSTGGEALLDSAEKDLRAAASARPDNAETWAALGETLLHQGRYAESAEASKVAYDADAFLTAMRSVVNWLFLASLYSEKYDAARHWCLLARERYVGDPRFVHCELTLLGATGNTLKDADAGWQMVRSIEQNDSAGMFDAVWSYRRMMVSAILARARERDSAQAVVTRTHTERRGRPPADAAEAYVHLLLGEREAALRLITAMVRASPISRPSVARNPWYRDLHDDPGFRALVDKKPTSAGTPRN